MKTLDSLHCPSEASGSQSPNAVACSLVGETFRVGALAMDKGQAEMEGPIFRDIRRYYCEYCGIRRSKKSLIASHILSHHKDEMEMSSVDEDREVEQEKSNTCQECGVSFRKPAHLKQHMQSHSLERPYICSVDDCHSSYRRKDHLNRHLLQHQGKLFKCPIENCNREFGFQGNMRRHVNELHSEDSPSTNGGAQKQHVCKEIGCGKVFRFASRLRKHEDSHVKLDTVEAFCSEPGCMKHFTNEQCLQAHIHSCHQHTTCEICGTKQLRNNIKRHLLTHEDKHSIERIKCDYKGCLHTFTTKSNLTKHVKAVHLEHKPFVCSFSGCGLRFAYKHVRDNHEKTGCHVYTQGDFEEADEQFRSRPRGGRKRECPDIPMLVRKRVTPPNQLGQECEYISWLHSQEDNDEQ
ncbi:hypothetical protein PRUPE_1G551600 [Prunus persica]|uniref:C2H2-type domain-containing protein n=2 Tax=Prunus persica TaxID=3760 RepID=A0A251RIW5_PRUPE|nr:transcription factor IIIA [Prunus persica]ONI35730.1 hypothetical protein PRUPE_1G551600 [Prunus persica]